MARRDNKANNWAVGVFGDGHFAQLKEELFFSTAFKSLDPQSKIVLLTMFMQYKGEKYTDKLTVICPYTEFKRVGIKQNATISKALIELELFGFIKIKRSNIRKVPNEYTFTGQWRSVNEEQAKQLKAQVKDRIKAIKTDWKNSHTNYEYKPTPNMCARSKANKGGANK